MIQLVRRLGPLLPCSSWSHWPPCPGALLELGKRLCQKRPSKPKCFENMLRGRQLHSHLAAISRKRFAITNNQKRRGAGALRTPAPRHERGASWGRPDLGFSGLGVWTLLAMSRVQGRVFTSSRVLEGLDKTFRRAQASRGLEGQGGLGGGQIRPGKVRSGGVSCKGAVWGG